MMRKLLASAILGLTAGLPAGLPASAAVASGPRVPVVPEIASARPAAPWLPECQEEDSRNCVWHAELHGNGIGDDFVDIEGVAHYAPYVHIPPAPARSNPGSAYVVAYPRCQSSSDIPCVSTSGRGARLVLTRVPRRSVALPTCKPRAEVPCLMPRPSGRQYLVRYPN